MVLGHPAVSCDLIQNAGCDGRGERDLSRRSRHRIETRGFPEVPQTLNDWRDGGMRGICERRVSYDPMYAG